MLQKIFREILFIEMCEAPRTDDLLVGGVEPERKKAFLFSCFSFHAPQQFDHFFLIEHDNLFVPFRARTKVLVEYGKRHIYKIKIAVVILDIEPVQPRVELIHIFSRPGPCSRTLHLNGDRLLAFPVYQKEVVKLLLSTEWDRHRIIVLLGKFFLKNVGDIVFGKRNGKCRHG